ncbi:aldo/keto reductase [Acidianus sulfidivorans JP7]|uniref:Aldo/keto reductase n=1 Tax=Acidianus sulfidivorans JP7 TaxID=619593 RepID=A0A2U9IPQ3_9CREN|nr:aldo/keto reductase [Acidianus sulfidivorans]AWR97954.1 aldo/keto reductase [Acidianus sulfidivorans JP7]
MELCKKELKIPIGLGTWKMGGGYWTADYSNDQKYIDIIRYAIEKGINLIDTAEMYGGGHTEELVGKAIKDFDREKLIIITKVWPSHLKYDQVLTSAMNSLKRLQSEYIDLYLIHWPNPEIDLNETFNAMNKLLDEGIVKCIGVSNFSVDLLKKSPENIEANEIEYNLYNLSPEYDIIPYCQKKGIKIIAYSPLAQGRINQDKRILEIAKKYNKSPAQISLNYLSMKSIPIPKASKKEHIDEIIESLNFKLSNEDIELLRSRL